MKCLTAYLIESSSRLKVEYLCCSGLKDFDQKPNGTHLPPIHWSRLAPQATLEASVDNDNGAEGTGKFRVTAFDNSDLASLKEFFKIGLESQICLKSMAVFLNLQVANL